MCLLWSKNVLHKVKHFLIGNNLHQPNKRLQIKSRIISEIGLSRWLSGKESTCQSRRHGFDPWSGKIPHAVEQLSPWVTTIKPVLQSPEAAAIELTYCNYCWFRALKSVLSNNRSRAQQVESRPHSLQLEKSPRSGEDWTQPWINKIIKREREDAPKERGAKDPGPGWGVRVAAGW